MRATTFQQFALSPLTAIPTTLGLMQPVQPRRDTKRSPLLLLLSVLALLTGCTFGGHNHGGGGGGGNGGGGNGGGGQQLTPAVTSVSPTSVGQNSGPFTLTVSGSGFGAGAVVYFAGNAIPSGATSAASTLTVTVPNSDIQNAGRVQVAVSDADNISSNNVNFTIQPGSPSCVLSFGQYAFLASGSNAKGAVAMAGSMAVGSDGSITGGSFDFKDHSTLLSNQPITGGPGSCADNSVANTGTLSFVAGGVKRTFNFSMKANDGYGNLVEADSTGVMASGEMYFQYQAAVDPFGSFAFGLQGADDAGDRYVIAGALCSNSSLDVTYVQADLDDNNINAAMQGISGAVSYSAPDTNGRSTVTPITFANGNSLNLTLYLLGSGTALAIESSPVATSTQVLSGFLSGQAGSTCLPNGQGGSFSNASLPASVLEFQGEQTGVVTASLGLVNNINPTGGINGQGTASLTQDSNAGGAYSQLANAPATYSISSSGRGVLSYTDAAGQPGEMIFYLDGTGFSYLIGMSGDVPAGYGTRQKTPPTIGGTYASGTMSIPGAATPLPVTEIVISNTNLTFQDLSPNGSISSAAYVLDTTSGRGTATFNNPTTFGDTSVVFYIIGPRYVATLPTATSKPLVGLLVR
jgi:hypothetical protein